MANFIDCTTNGFSVETILGSMFSKIEGSRLPLTGFRIEKYEDDVVTILTCDNFVTWVELFKEALSLDLNGNATLRVNIMSVADLGEDDLYALAPSCGTWEGFEDLFKQSFCQLEDGNIAFLLIDTTTVV